MQKFSLGLVVLAALAVGALRAEETVPGLVAEYFEGQSEKFEAPNKKPFLVRVDKQVNFEVVSGEFHGARLTDNFYARWTGQIKIAKAGKYSFFTTSDDGSRLLIDDKVVVDNGGMHPMEEKGGAVELTEGQHNIKIEFYQGGGEAGCKAMWQTPGGAKEPIPAGVLSFKKGADAIEWDKAAFEAKKPAVAAKPKANKQRWEQMDYGPYIGSNLNAGGENMTLKAVNMKLGGDAEGCMGFDTELLRMSAAWSGRLIDGRGTQFDGAHGPGPNPGTPAQVQTKRLPGWAIGDTASFTDPRDAQDGPLPESIAKYRGLYLHGDKIVLSYTVGDAQVLEVPGVEKINDEYIFTRTFEITGNTKPLTMAVADADLGAVAGKGLIASVNAKSGVNVEIKDTRLLLKIPAGDKLFKLAFGNLTDAARQKLGEVIAAPPTAPKDYTKGGPPRWNETITVAGTLSTDDKSPYVVDTIPVPEDNPWKAWMRIGGMDFFADGKRAAVSTWSGDVWIVSGIDAKLEKVTWKRYATGLFQPLGLKIVDDVIYTLGRDQITRLHDLNQDGEADFYENFNNDCIVTTNFHEFAFDLQTDKEGSFYYSKGSPVRGGGRGFERISKHNGVIMKVSKDGKKSEVFATGLRAPNGIGVSPDGSIITSGDNEGTWVPACPINLVKKGGFLGVVDAAHRAEKPTARDYPICWLPRKLDNSGGGQVWVTSDKWGPFNNRLMHMSYGTCSLYLVMTQDVGDVMQGGVVKFPLNFLSGTMRARFNPADGQLYIVGLRGWQTTASRDGMFQRVRYADKPVHMPTELKVTKTALEVTFTQPLDPKTAEDAESYTVERWNVNWTETYGSPEFSVADPKKHGRDPMDVKSAKLTNGGKTVVLTLDDIKPVTNMVIKVKVKAADGTDVSQEISHTINKVP